MCVRLVVQGRLLLMLPSHLHCDRCYRLFQMSPTPQRLGVSSVADVAANAGMLVLSF